MRTITTKFVGPTNYKDARVLVYHGNKHETVSWDHARDVRQNHESAAQSVAAALEWGQFVVGVALPDTNNHAYVFLFE